MTEHEAVRAMLARAAAGLLQPEEVRRVEHHVQGCEPCRRDLETWDRYAQGLRKLPQPSAPEGLAQRTHARILRERAEATERLRQEQFLGALMIFGWGAGWVFWALARAITGGSLKVFGANLLNGVTWTAVSTLLVWMTAGTVALMLGRHREMRRFL